MPYSLPDPLFSWAWTSQYLAKSQREVLSPGGIILPDQPQDVPEPAYAHFSRMGVDGEISWLWLFSDRKNAAALRVLPSIPQLENDSLAELVGATLPRRTPWLPQPVFLQVVDRNHLGNLPLRELGIHEVWIDFDYKIYARDRSLDTAVPIKMTAEEFAQAAKS